MRPSRQQRESDYGFVLRLDLFKQFCFELMRDWHLAGGELFWSRFDEAKLAVTKALVAVFVHGSNRRRKDAADHRTPRVNVAAAGRGVECGASGVVGEIFKAGLIGV